ncbi:MAG: transglutaminase-like cysteine peptidase [Hyphomicrobiaceae bacterium]|nr:transglutaminase-like cysteine peptidase [Hyphomicrobiaceae bacterium]
MPRKVGIASIATFMLSVSPVAVHQAKAVESTRYMEVRGTTTAPMGFVQFCRENPADCQPRSSNAVMALSKARWDELVRVNEQVNNSIEPVTDQDNFGVVEWWTYPENKRGDCEDYVLLKRKVLMDRGWPDSALLITVVRDEKGDGHAVLTARTDKGDMILDNQNPTVLPWSRTAYTFVKRQSASNSARWESVAARPVETALR